MNKFTGYVLLLIGSASLAFAGPVSAPEIDASSTVGALTLLSGALLVLRARLKR